jgi:putative transposase
MERKVPFVPGEYYHIYNRGVEKREVFMDTADHRRFLELAYLCNGAEPVVLKLIPEHERFQKDVGEQLVSICAFALMPNHFHFLVREKRDGGITQFMRKLTTGYTMYFNTRYDRVGPLFQGIFKSTHVSDDQYMRHVLAYIHVNPVKIYFPEWQEVPESVEVLLASALEYPFSSVPTYQGKSNEFSGIVDTHSVPQYWESAEDFVSDLSRYLEAKSSLQGPTLE